MATAFTLEVNLFNSGSTGTCYVQGDCFYSHATVGSIATKAPSSSIPLSALARPSAQSLERLSRCGVRARARPRKGG